MEQHHFFMSLLALTCGILSAKWAMEQGRSQFAQVLWGLAGLLLGPLILLILYVRLLATRQERNEPGGQWVSASSAESQSRLDTSHGDVFSRPDNNDFHYATRLSRHADCIVCSGDKLDRYQGTTGADGSHMATDRREYK